MINANLREYIRTQYPQTVLFDAPAFDNSIVGFTSCGNVCYNYDKMIIEFSHDNNCTHDESVEFIDYNTVRSIPYINNDYKPIIIYPIIEV